VVTFLKQRFASRRWVAIAVVVMVLLGARLAGLRTSALWLAALVAGIALTYLLEHPFVGVLAIIPTALWIPFDVPTGTSVRLNPVTLLLIGVIGIWILDKLRRRDLHVVPSTANLPLFLFVLSSFLSLLVGNALWDVGTPRPAGFISVQLAQCAIFALSAGAFWLVGNLMHDLRKLRWLTVSFLVVGGLAALVFILARNLNVGGLRLLTVAVMRAPFWMLLSAVAGGQLLFNSHISWAYRALLFGILGMVFFYVFFIQRETVSNWVSVVAVLGVLCWLRWPKLRWPVVLLLSILIGTGVLSSAVYDLAGGDEEWTRTGGSRLVLIGRVLEETLRNPITGLGPAAYRPYARTRPLPYGRAVWFGPNISSHNNYVDLFSHVGLLGLALFSWFSVETAMLGIRLRAHFADGFAAGYLNAAIASGASALTLMLFADWILPFVYNIGFLGFQASLLVWMFLGGLVSLQRTAGIE
jgi:O-antigen ligase/polysaccharide polymerase Wzy-like membrane protein